MMFLGADFIVTVRHGAHSPADRRPRRRWRPIPEQLAIGPAAVMHAIADRIVDEYLTVVEAVEDDIDEMENAVFTTDEAGRHRADLPAQAGDPAACAGRSRR